MEMTSIRLTSSLIAVLIFVGIIGLIRKGRLHEKYSLGWFLIGWGILIFGTFPKIVDRIASSLGIHYPPILLVYVGLGLLFIQQLYLFIYTSQNEARIKELAQQLAILRKLIEETDGEKKENPLSTACWPAGTSDCAPGHLPGPGDGQARKQP